MTYTLQQQQWLAAGDVQQKPCIAVTKPYLIERHHNRNMQLDRGTKLRYEQVRKLSTCIQANTNALNTTYALWIACAQGRTPHPHT
jgi:hypothetical protein